MGKKVRNDYYHRKDGKKERKKWDGKDKKEEKVRKERRNRNRGGMRG